MKARLIIGAFCFIDVKIFAEGDVAMIQSLQKKFTNVSVLPDKNQKILVYCWTGRRVK